jgi:hypothetical protein
MLVNMKLCRVPQTIQAVLLLFALTLHHQVIASAQSGYELPYSDEMVAEFARVKLQVDEIKAQYNERIQAADSHEESERLAAEANEFAAKAIQESVLSFDLYQRMQTDLRNDPGFRGRVLYIMSRLKQGR